MTPARLLVKMQSHWAVLWVPVGGLVGVQLAANSALMLPHSRVLWNANVAANGLETRRPEWQRRGRPDPRRATAAAEEGRTSCWKQHSRKAGRCWQRTQRSEMAHPPLQRLLVAWPWRCSPPTSRTPR